LILLRLELSKLHVQLIVKTHKLATIVILVKHSEFEFITDFLVARIRFTSFGIRARLA